MGAVTQMHGIHSAMIDRVLCGVRVCVRVLSERGCEAIHLGYL